MQYVQVDLNHLTLLLSQVDYLSKVELLSGLT